jgi:hypothetical protein
MDYTLPPRIPKSEKQGKKLAEKIKTRNIKKALERFKAKK